MLLVGEAVPHRHAAVLREVLDVLLLEAAELDAVEHAAQHERGVAHRLLLAQLDVVLAQVLGVRAQVDAGRGERGAGAGGRLLEQQRDVLAREVAVLDVALLQVLEVLGEPDEVRQLVLRVVPRGEEAASLEYGIGHVKLLSMDVLAPSFPTDVTPDRCDPSWQARLREASYAAAGGHPSGQVDKTRAARFVRLNKGCRATEI